MRILITGSRTWTDYAVIEEVLGEYLEYPDVTLVSGHCAEGADALCERFADLMGWTAELHAADWEKYGKKAGYIRNADMVSLGADVCLAFIRNRSRGATMTAGLALQAGIPVRSYVDSTELPTVPTHMKDRIGV